MKFKIIIFFLMIGVLTCNLVYGQVRDAVPLTKFTHTGFYLGAYNSGLGWDDYVVGLMMSYYSDEWNWSSELLDDLGFLLSIAYFTAPDEDLSFIPQLSKGFWLTERSLIQFAMGPLMSYANGFGVSGTVLVGVDNIFPRFEVFDSGVVFLQSDRYQSGKVGEAKWRYTLGISFGI